MKPQISSNLFSVPGKEKAILSGRDFGKLKVLVGIVVPYAWDSQHSIIEIAISTPGEREYQIDMNGMGKSLMKYLHRPVNVEGYISPSHKSAGVINVQAYSVED